MSNGLQAEIDDLASRSEAVRLGAIERLRRHGSFSAAAAIAGRLGDPSIAVRRAVSDGLAQNGAEETGTLLVCLLRRNHLDFTILSGLVDALEQTPLPVTDAIAGLLTSPEVNLRIQAALILGLRGDMRAIPALEAALGDCDHNVRCHAIEALGRLGSRASLPRLLAIAEREDITLAFAAAAAIGAIGNEAAARRLEALLQRPELAIAAASALGRVGDAASLQALAAALLQPQSARPVLSAMAAILRRHPEAADELRHPLGPVALGVIEHCAAGASTGELADIVELLRRLDGPAAVSALATALEHAARLTTDAGIGTPERARQPVEVAIAAIRALGETRSPLAIEPILTLMADRNGQLVVPLIKALGRIGSPAAIDAIWARLGDPEMPVREGAIAALRAIDGIDRARIDALLRADDPLLRYAAVRLWPSDATSSAVFLSACRDDDPSVRRAAVSRLPEIRGDEGPAALARALDDCSAQVRVAAAQGLSRIDASAAQSGLAQALSDSDAWVRYHAVRSARAVQADVESRLIELAADDNAAFVRIAAIEALGDRSSSAARSALQAIVRADLPDVVDVASRALLSMQGERR